MKRRTKKEMELVNEECRHFLMYNKLDAHKAYNAYIKNYLESGISLPYYIEGIKDFLKVSKVMQVEQEQKQARKERELEQAENNQTAINKILNLSYESVIGAYRESAKGDNKNHKMVLCDMANLIYAKEWKEKFITGHYIDVCREYSLI